MNLTEPEAGSDVGALRTKAVPPGRRQLPHLRAEDLHHLGDHDLTDNIVHLVLARTPDARRARRASRCFIVPKFLVDDEGRLGERNDVHGVSIEHKLGIQASPTCVLAYGDEGEGAVGYLVGGERAGMREMFTMMNNARLGVGARGSRRAERAYQRAVELRRSAGRAGRPVPPGG